MNQGFNEIGAWLQGYLGAVAANAQPLEEKRVVVCPPAHVIEYIDSELVGASMTYFEEEIKKQGKKMEDFSPEDIQEVVMSSRAFSLGAQDCHHEASGAYTGDISAKMLGEIGCEFVIVGHSERRHYHRENDKIVAKKAKAAIENNILPVICIGESKEIRAEGKHLEFLKDQIINSIPQDTKIANLIIAYEPIWSIGTGKTPSLEELEEAAAHIEKSVKENLADKYDQLYIVYGGSINSKNSESLMNTPGISGLLVGKASLDANEFSKIVGLV